MTEKAQNTRVNNKIWR